MTVLFLDTTQTVIYFTAQDVTFLQSLEGTKLNSDTILKSIPPNMKQDNCFMWKFDIGSREFSVNVPTQEQRLLNYKARLLAKIQTFTARVRRPYSKQLIDQDSIYSVKYAEAVKYIESNNADRAEVLRTSTYFADEVDIMKKDPLITALEIQRAKLERDFIYRSSERARRALIEKVCFAQNAEELNVVNGLITDRNFKLPMVV